MSSKTAAKAAKTAQAINRVIPVHKKYTVQSVGIWEVIRRFFAIDPNRSNGIPLNPQFRNPPPGSNAPFSFTDPVTIPAGDIADNAYWRRDVRRAYPQLSVVAQRDLVGVLRLGSRAEPRKELVGEEGEKEVAVVLKGDGNQGKGGLGVVLSEGDGQLAKGLCQEGGMPPLPASMGGERLGADKYALTDENAYPEQYPCRTFQ